MSVATTLPKTDLDEFLAAECGRLRIPGAVMGVIRGNEAHIATYGVTSVADPLPVTADTLFMIGSTTKTITATALLALTEQGRLDLDDRVIDHLPDLTLADAKARASVTVGQLLDHTAGWAGEHGESDPGWGDHALAAMVEEMVSPAPQITPPGSLMSYNNASLVLAGHLVATLTGSPYEDAVRQLVLEPLGLTDTWFFPWDIAQRRFAVGHAPKGEDLVPELDWPMIRGGHPAGGVISTARDMATWAQFHLDGTSSGAAPISDGTRLLMQRQRVSVGSFISGVGLPWLLRDYRGLRLAQHGGNVSNLHTSSFVLAPSEGMAVFTMATSLGGKVLGAAALDHVLDDMGLAPQPVADPVFLEPDRLAEYVGTYDAGHWDLEVSVTDNGLGVRTRLHEGDDLSDEVRATFEGPLTEVVFVAPDVVAVADNLTETMGDFIRDPQGRIQFLRYGLRVSPRRS